ncbi:hypothetical protein PoB_007357900 [Plakobranchus ocellatus]|uniref:Uncharacterized protein n=1 Tax=Plakobranchus ocellatus TaxID=259542 RepID=A0AAV4DSC0_9GAST|nr:hypothetical protein PoB_007357900 [Plakobranchus ocellatus]
MIYPDSDNLKVAYYIFCAEYADHLNFGTGANPKPCDPQAIEDKCKDYIDKQFESRMMEAIKAKDIMLAKAFACE